MALNFYVPSKMYSSRPQGSGTAKEEEAPHLYLTLNNVILYIKIPVSSSEPVCSM